MDKRMKMISFIIFFVIIIILGYVIYSNATKNSSEKTLEEKIITEIEYLEVKITNMANRINNITTQNYKVTVKSIEKSSGQGENSSSSSESGQSTQSQGNGGSNNSEGNNESQNSSGKNGSSSSSGQSGNESEEKAKLYNMERINNLEGEKEINWDDIQKEIEEIYTIAPTVTLDLYQTSINQEDILKFNSYLDDVANGVKSKDENVTLQKLCDMYTCISKFAENVSKDELFKTEIKTKENVLKGYSKVNLDNWQEVIDNLQTGIDCFAVLLTNTNINYGKQVNINKIYVILNELKNAASKKDKEVFFIKYKNLLEEMNSL